MRWRENTGKLPRDLRGTSKRIVVELANGMVSGKEPLSATTPPGWPADGKGACRWSLTGHPFDIARFHVIGEQA